MNDQDNSDSSLGRRVRGFIVVAVLSALCAYFSIHLAYVAWADNDMSFALRAAFLTLAALLLAVVCYLCGSPIVRKIRTGRFLMTRAELLAKRAEIRGCMGAGKPFWPQARIWFFGWIFLAILATIGISTLIAAVGMCHCTPSFAILVAALGLVLLALPGWFVFKGIRRKMKTGSFLPSQEEIDRARTQCAQPRPVWLRILLAGLYWIVALMWTVSALLRHTHYHGAFGSPWVLPALWWLVAAIWTWQIFHPRSTRCAIDSGLPPSGNPSAN